MLKILELVHPKKLSSEDDYGKLLAGDQQEEAKAYHQLIDSSIKKQELIEAFLKDFEKGVAKTIKNEVKTFKKLNKYLLDSFDVLLLDLKRDDEASKLFFYKLFQGQIKSNENFQKYSADRKKDYYQQFRLVFANVNLIFSTIKQLLEQENEYLRKNNLLQIASDLKKHGHFFLLLHYEKQKFEEIEHNILLVLQYLGQIERFVDENLEREEMKHYRFDKVAPYSKDMKHFYYGPYIDRFPDPGEREAFSALNDLVANNGYHVLVAKHQSKIVGGIVYAIADYIPSKGTASQKTYSIVIVYWNCVVKTIKETGIIFLGTRLVQAMFADLKSISSYSNKPLLGIFAEINDPADDKMTDEDLGDDLQNYDTLKRINFWQRNGFFPMFKEYVQLTSDPKNYVDYCTLFLYPNCDRWKQGLQGDELIDVLYTMQIKFNDYKPEFLATYKHWLRMKVAIKPHQFYALGRYSENYCQARLDAIKAKKSSRQTA